MAWDRDAAEEAEVTAEHLLLCGARLEQAHSAEDQHHPHDFLPRERLVEDEPADDGNYDDAGARPDRVRDTGRNTGAKGGGEQYE